MKSIKKVCEELELTADQYNVLHPLRRLRLHLGLTVREMAAYIGVAKSAIYNYECGIRQPNIDVAHRIINKAKAFGIDVTLEQIKPERR